MKSQIRYLFMTSLVFAVTGISASAVAADKPERVPAKAPQSQSRNIEFENDLVKMIVIPRTREQMKAFYEGRGFPPSAIAAIAEACFMTVIVKNKSDKILWLELENWRFSSTAADVRRLDRGYWKQRWQTLGVPMASQSTFGWTLLPERRDLQVDEGVGGNITLAVTQHLFELSAKFFRGENKQSTPITVQLNNLQCAQ